MISRQIMFNNVNYFLGPQASVRPFTYQQREGYLINNPGGPLTKVLQNNFPAYYLEAPDSD